MLVIQGAWVEGELRVHSHSIAGDTPRSRADSHWSRRCSTSSNNSDHNICYHRLPWYSYESLKWILLTSAFKARRQRPRFSCRFDSLFRVSGFGSRECPFLIGDDIAVPLWNSKSYTQVILNESETANIGVCDCRVEDHKPTQSGGSKALM